MPATPFSMQTLKDVLDLSLEAELRRTSHCTLCGKTPHGEMFLPPSTAEQAAMVPNCNNERCTPFRSTLNPNKNSKKCVEPPDPQFNCKTPGDTDCDGDSC